MKIFRSIRARFTGWYLIVLALLLIALSIGLYAVLSFTLRRDLDRVLVHRATQIATMRDIRSIVNQGRFEAMLGEVVGFYTRSDSGFAVVSTREIEGVLEPEWIESAFAGRAVHVTADSPEGQPLRFYVSLLRPPIAAGGTPPADRAPPTTATDPMAPRPARPQAEGEIEPAVVVVAQPLNSIDSALSGLRTTLLIAIPMTLLLSAGGGLFLVRRALKPVDWMIETTRRIEETDLEARVDVQTGDELGRLAATLNAMLDRLANAFHRQRQFTDDASHELRTPLAVIEAEATLALRRERPAEDYRDALGIIAEEAGSMNRLIDQLLTLARSDAGSATPVFDAFDLAEMASEVVAAMEPIAEERGVMLKAEMPSSTLPMEGDPVGLRRIVVNLVENAIRHTEAGGSVTVTAGRTSEAIQLAVSDTGEGISAEHVAHIFERFYRVDEARTRGDGGSGLGLAICRAIAEAHGGRIEVESRLGEGSRFTLRLPDPLSAGATTEAEA